MKILISILCLVFLLNCINCTNQSQVKPFKTKSNQKEIINYYLKNGAWNHHYLTKEWNEWIDKGIQKDSTIALLWQQKALPFWKQKKYELATTYYNKAVQLDREKWLSRLAFLKCIFAKDYTSALIDINTYHKEFGVTYEQDHSLGIYQGICYLQLNQFEKALKTLKTEISKEEKERGVKWVHFLDRFYLAISFYELKKYTEAIAEFDKVLVEYSDFSDAQYYKSICLNYLGQKEDAEKLIAEGKSNYYKGNSFNEDSSKYEEYPYQVTWQWAVTQSILK